MHVIPLRTDTEQAVIDAQIPNPGLGICGHIRPLTREELGRIVRETTLLLNSKPPTDAKLQ